MSIQPFPNLRANFFATSKGVNRLFRRHLRNSLCWIAVVVCLASIATAQQAKLEIRVFPDSPGRVIVEGSCAAATVWSFRDSYADVLNLGSRIEGLRLFDAAGVDVPTRKIAPGQFQAATTAIKFRYQVNIA